MQWHLRRGDRRAQATLMRQGEDLSLELVENPGPAEQHSLVLDHEHAVAVATF